MPVKKSSQSGVVLPGSNPSTTSQTAPKSSSGGSSSGAMPIHINVNTDSKETLQQRVSWSILSSLGQVLTWPFRLIARIVERIADEGTSSAIKLISILLLILLLPLTLWLGVEIAVEYMKNRDAQGAISFGANALSELWGNFIDLIGGKS